MHCNFSTGIQMSKNLVGPRQFYETYLEFHEKIFTSHVKCMHHLIAVLPFEKLNQIDVANRLNQRKPILGEDNFIIEEKELEYIFDLIFPTFKKYFSRMSAQIARIEDLYDKRKLTLGKLSIAQLIGDKNPFMEISKKYDVSTTLLEKVIEFISSPYLELCAEFFNKKLAQFSWKQPFCPICGNPPSMAIVNEKKSQRNLWCRCCDTVWSFYEMVCPFCLNPDSNSQKIIFHSDRKPIRIDACDKCNNYIKTIDELISQQNMHISVKNVETFYLDLLAKNLGYNPPGYISYFLESL
jgi:FdhE protein